MKWTPPSHLLQLAASESVGRLKQFISFNEPLGAPQIKSHHGADGDIIGV